jgi:hypothetical protein
VSDTARVPESWESRVARWRFNWFPAYRGTGARVLHIGRDWTEVRVAVPLSWRTRNYVGTTFGGSIYGAVDPIYMVMLIRNLGRDYVVWDKAAAIRFRRPGRTTLYATFRLEPAVLEGIRLELAAAPRLDRVFTVELTDAAGLVHAIVDKTIHVSRR